VTLFSFIAPLVRWLDSHRAIAAVIVGVSIATFLVTLAAIPVLLTRIPPDYFSKRRPDTPWKHYHPVLRMLALAAKNVLGVILLIAGAIMLLTPGQGIITMLIGLALIDVPGKRALERWIVGRPRVLAAINRLRARYGHPPLEGPNDAG
jgi:putative transmembrane protein PGPGW